MASKLMQIGCAFDWISPTWMFVQMARHRGSRRINIHADGAWHTMRALRRYGIKVLAQCQVLSAETVVILVSGAQYRYATQMLTKWQVLK